MQTVKDNLAQVVQSSLGRQPWHICSFFYNETQQNEGLTLTARWRGKVSLGYSSVYKAPTGNDGILLVDVEVTPAALRLC